jgi:hypothetical protein
VVQIVLSTGNLEHQPPSVEAPYAYKARRQTCSVSNRINKPYTKTHPEIGGSEAHSPVFHTSAPLLLQKRDVNRSITTDLFSLSPTVVALSSEHMCTVPSQSLEHGATE